MVTVATPNPVGLVFVKTALHQPWMTQDDRSVIEV